MNVVFMLISTILVWLMVPGIAVFYSGFVPHKDVTRILFDSFLMFGLAGILWIAVGFPIVFEGDHFGIIGNFHHLFLSGIDLSSTYGTTKLPTSVYLLFQMMFAILTPALFLGAVASRVRIRFIILFVTLWSLLIYYPLAHIVWSSTGFLAKMGVLDFAGGTVIHINAGITALILAITLREPYKYNNEQAKGNPLWILMGTVLLWLGWYGFNAGSALDVSFQTINAFFTTTVAACASLITWIGLEQIFKHKVTLSGICTGSICGLVGITPGTGYVTIFGSVIIGIISAVGSYYFMNYLKYQLHLNDYLDIFGCHGISGIIGSICVGLFATKSVNSNVITNGLLYGGGLKQLGLQLFGVIFTIAFVSIFGIIIVQVLKKLFKDDVGIRNLELV
ncbi:ammonium transporter [Companilactobacillus huachuanensis]|uniref:Ammonium transporter n=1 Tax=Companilactobacillus huachuanensis TaxID=2559914 RepID=A0ABW1RLB3_9LACO|nr:ammonium transporter [Companilactobacillus huachuanensis]